MKTRQWYRARIRWAEMVEGRGIRNWKRACSCSAPKMARRRFGVRWRSARAVKAAGSWRRNLWRSIG